MLKKVNLLIVLSLVSYGLVVVFLYNQVTWNKRLLRDLDVFKAQVEEILPGWKISEEFVGYPLVAATTNAIFIPSPGGQAKTPEEFVERLIEDSGSQALREKTVIFPTASAATDDYFEYSFGACEPICVYDLLNLSESTRNAFDVYYSRPKDGNRSHWQLALEQINGRAFSSHLTIEMNSLGEVRSYSVTFRISQRNGWDGIRMALRNRSPKSHLNGYFEYRNVFLEGFK